MAATKAQLKKARGKRSRTAQTLGMLESGRIALVDILLDVPEELERVRIYVLLRRAPHMGEKGADRVLQLADVWPLTRLGDLSPRARRLIIEYLPARARR